MLATFPVYSQELGGVAGKFHEYRQNNLQEKLYVHTDRDFYLCGEIIWCKIYYVDGVSHRPLNLSKVAYVEVLDSGNNAVLQAKIHLENGVGEGSLFIPTTINSGDYKFRAYTSWMKNFSPEFYFHKDISIVNSFRNLVKTSAEKETIYQPDVQFFPEGGNLVAGLKSKVAFRAVDPRGNSFDFNGAVVSSEGDTVAFEPAKFGMGYFYFTPKEGVTYKAIITDDDKNRYDYPMPEVFKSGYVLNLEDEIDELRINVSSKPEIQQNLQLFVHCRQQIVKSETKMFKGDLLTFAVSKSDLKEGVNHFTVFDQNGSPLCERLYFKQPDNFVNFRSEIADVKFGTREKVSVELQAKDNSSVPLPANFSVAVYQMDSLNEAPDVDILSYLLLTSDLSGTVESPGFYFQKDIEGMVNYVDNLMLTHGWRRFAWKDVLQYEKQLHTHVPEYVTHNVQAKVTDKQTGKGVENVEAYLSVTRNFVKLGSDKSDEKGMLTFEFDHFFGPGYVYLQTHNGKNDTSYLFETISPFSKDFAELSSSDLHIDPSIEGALLSRSINMQTRNVYLHEKLNAYGKSPDTASFYLRPDKTYYLDDYTRFTIMEDVMREYVPEIWVRIKDGNFYYRTLDVQRNVMFEKNPVIFYDGVPVFDINKLMKVDPLKVKKMEILTRKYFLGDLSFDGVISYTTYRGNMDGYEVDPAVSILEYDGLQLRREFYQPRYDTPENKLSRLPDFRNLLYWQPNMNTDGEGKAKIEFYTSDQQGKYLVVVQGITNKGLAGSETFTFTVQKEVN